jgi:succinoglycan biosynthesis transport protein ExoP
MPVLGSTLKGDALYSRETLRRISLSIMRERRQGGTRVFVITAVGEKAGTSSLTLALSNELTELGASAVALEANALHPDIRYQNGPAANGYGYTNGSGHVNGVGSDGNGHGVVAKVNSFDVCVHKIINASGSLPDRMAICQRQRYARLAMKCVQESLELALAGHDLVLMDAPPVLGSADTAMLVQNPAGVIVVVRAERDRLEDVTAAIQELNKLSPPVVGVVMQRDPIVDMGVNPPREIKYGELQIQPVRRAPAVPASTVS